MKLRATATAERTAPAKGLAQRAGELGPGRRYHGGREHIDTGGGLA